MDALYIPSAADTAAGLVTLVLTSTGAASCAVVTDTMKITITNAPVTDIPADTIYACSNNPDSHFQEQFTEQLLRVNGPLQEMVLSVPIT